MLNLLWQEMETAVWILHSYDKDNETAMTLLPLTCVNKILGVICWYGCCWRYWQEVFVCVCLCIHEQCVCPDMKVTLTTGRHANPTELKLAVFLNIVLKWNYVHTIKINRSGSHLWPVTCDKFKRAPCICFFCNNCWGWTSTTESTKPLSGHNLFHVLQMHAVPPPQRVQRQPVKMNGRARESEINIIWKSSEYLDATANLYSTTWIGSCLACIVK